MAGICKDVIIVDCSTVFYSFDELCGAKLSEFKKSVNKTNIVYFFCKESECLYIGETGTSLHDRIFKHTTKEKNQPWFKEADRIHIISLDDDNMRNRKALEALVIVLFNPRYNSGWKGLCKK